MWAVVSQHTLDREMVSYTKHAKTCETMRIESVGLNPYSSPAPAHPLTPFSSYALHKVGMSFPWYEQRYQLRK